jgi:outer membrane protein
MNSQYKMITIFFILNAISLCILSAQQKQLLTVDKAIEIGLKNSKALHLSQMKVEAASAKAGEVNTYRLPSLKALGSYTRLSDVPAFEASVPKGAFGTLPSIGPFPPQDVSFPLSQTILNNYNLKLSLQQPIFTGWRVQSSSDIADDLSNAAGENFSKEKANIIYQIKTTYWNLYKSQEFQKVINENVEQIKAHAKDARNFYDQGMLTKNEVLKVEVQLSNIEVLQIDAKNNVQLAMLALNNVIGLPLDTEIKLSDSIAQQSRDYSNVDVLVRTALDLRPEIKEFEYNVKAGKSAVTLARSGWFPQIYLTGNYNYSRPNQRIVPTLDKFKDTWDVTLSASLDIWNWGSTIHQTNQAQAQLAQVQDALGQLKDGIILEVTQSYLNYNQSKEKIGVAQKGVAQAEENYRITQEKFKSGIALNSDLLDAEAALLQARWNNIQALVDHELADAQLKKAIGENHYSEEN